MVRQGDILLLPAAKDAQTAAHVLRPREDGAVVLARGEQTGHTHAIYEEKVRLYATARATDDAVLVVEENAALVHQEHSAIPLLPGVYLVRRQREYSDADDDGVVVVED